MGCLYWLTISMAVPMVLSWHSVTYYPEQVGEPTGVNYDSPYAACNVSGTVRGYSANQESYLVAQGSTANNWLSTPQAINLTRGSALDTCGSWLNAVVYDEAADLVRGYYHEEWNCNYSDHSFTNKSVAYAESHDGGLTFSKPNYPSNTIILPPRGNTTRRHQTGEGDHTVVVRGDYMYLYFFEWDGFEDIPHVSVARATTASGGVPGSWWKWYNGSYSQPGLHGDSDMLTGMHDASSVRYRHQQQDYISVQQSGSTGLQVMHSTNGLDFEALPVVLVPTDYPNWTRASTSGELYAYVSPVGLGGTHDVQHDFSLYYTYLQPGETFAQRYPTRRSISLSNTSGSSLIELVMLRNATDVWTTTALIPQSYAYSSPQRLGFLLTQNVSEAKSTTLLHDCLLNTGVWMSQPLFGRALTRHHGNLLAPYGRLSIGVSPWATRIFTPLGLYLPTGQSQHCQADKVFQPFHTNV
eukprot:m.105914 g.105914  ORF g.105914 m.105914 type:complete len:468 (+) comp15294_c0_seq14:3-1406(+)